MRRRVRALAGLGLAVALVALGGCGSAPESSSADDAQSSTAPESPSSSEASPSPARTPAQTRSPAPSAGGTPAAANPDLCGLLTVADFEAITGQPAAGEPTYGTPMTANRGMCTWVAKEGFALVMLAAYDAADLEVALTATGIKPVEGLGTEAHWDPKVGLLLEIADADWYLQVIATGESPEFDRDRSIEVARLVLDRL